MDDRDAACTRWVQRTTRAVAAARYDLVIMTNRISVNAVGSNLQQSQARYRAGYRPVVAAFLASGARRQWLPAEPLVGTLQDLADPRARLADLTDRLCPDSDCPAVIGGVPVFFDGSHMTSTFSQTLEPYLAPALRAVVHR